MTHRAAAAALAITALLALPAVGTPQVPASKVKVGICADPDRFDAAQAVGFDYIEVNASKTAALSDEEFAQLAERVKGLRIPVEAANVFIPAAIKLVGPEVDTARQESYAASTLARLKALGVKVLVLGSGGARRVPDGFSRDEAFAQLVDFCRRLAPIAGRNGITIAIEPLRRQESNIINTAREGLALAKAVDRPEIKLLVDYYHLSQEAESADVLKEAGRFLRLPARPGRIRLRPLLREPLRDRLQRPDQHRGLDEGLCRGRAEGARDVAQGGGLHRSSRELTHQVGN